MYVRSIRKENFLMNKQFVAVEMHRDIERRHEDDIMSVVFVRPTEYKCL